MGHGYSPPCGQGGAGPRRGQNVPGKALRRVLYMVARRRIVLALLAATALFVAACGSSNNSSSSSGSSSGGTKVSGAKVIDPNSMNNPPKGTITYCQGKDTTGAGH